MTVVTPADRPKSVRKRCVIEVFGGVFVLSFGFRIFCWYRGFCHRSESDLLLFLFALFCSEKNSKINAEGIFYYRLGRTMQECKIKCYQHHVMQTLYLHYFVSPGVQSVMRHFRY